MSNPAFTPQDHGHMRRALELAIKGFGRTKPNPMVGAVIVKDGAVVGEGWHTAYGAPHAEQEALAMAGEHARGADLYVTLEPCNHTGHTPPCAEAILQAGVKRVVMAGLDPNPRVTGGGAARLESSGVTVMSGLLAEEAEILNEPFLTAMRRQRPYVVLKAAVSVDGFLATTDNDSGQRCGGMSGPESHARVHQLRAALDAVLVGGSTVLHDDPLLTARGLPGVRQPRKVILDHDLMTPPGARLFDDNDQPPLFLAGPTASPAHIQRLEAAGAQVEILPAAPGQHFMDPATILSRLWDLGITSVLVEGGGQVHGSFMAAGLFDRMELFITPHVFGRGVPLFDGPAWRSLAQTPDLRFESACMLGQDVHLVARSAETKLTR